MTIIADSLQAIKAKIIDSTVAANRTDHVQLLAVSKAQTADKLREAFSYGQRCFGENYVQEAINKQASLSDLQIEWHFIGPIQSNKTTPIAEHFDWVHSVDRLKIAERLAMARPIHLKPINVCIQINISNEETKSGVDASELLTLANKITGLPNLKLRGIMAIPEATKDLAKQRAQFKMVSNAYVALKQQGLVLDTLSIGMSEDFEAAIMEGSTIVRIGSAIFGARAL